MLKDAGARGGPPAHQLAPRSSTPASTASTPPSGPSSSPPVRAWSEIEDFLGVDSLHYLSFENLVSSTRRERGIEFCLACFDGDYPIPVPEELRLSKYRLEKKDEVKAE